MSSRYVRTLFRTWCQSVATATGVPFYDTINQHQSPSDDTWWTVEFVADGHEGNFCDREYIERGFVDIIVRARPGIGDDTAFAAIEQIVPLLAANSDIHLVIESYDPPNDDTGGSAEEAYGVVVQANYVYNK